MIKALGIILLVVILSVAVPTRDKWSYKAMYDRNVNGDTDWHWSEKTKLKDKKKR